VEVVDVRRDKALGEAVRSWTEGVLPGEPQAADRAAAVALFAYRHGASIPEACHAARGFVGSWSRHPSHAEIERAHPLSVAS